MTLIFELILDLKIRPNPHLVNLISACYIKSVEALELLKREKEFFSHAYLILGRDRLKIQALLDFIIQRQGVHKFDILEVNGEIKVATLRDLLHQIQLTPHGPARLAILWGVENLNAASSNILLKALEEPPGRGIIVLIAAQDNVLPTIRSRCRILRLGPSRPTAVIAADFIERGFACAAAEIEKIVKNNEVGAFLDALEENLQIKDRDAVWAKRLEKIFLARKKIKSNVNPRLVLENLVLAFYYA